MKNFSVAQCHFYSLRNKFHTNSTSIFLLKPILIFCALLVFSADAFAQVEETEYEVVDKVDEYKKVCWPIVSTSKTEATTNKMKTDTTSSPSPMSGGLGALRKLYNAVEVPNNAFSLPFPNPDTAEIFDLLGNPLIINGTTITFTPSPVTGALASLALNTTSGYHWVGYESNAFQPDKVGVYYYNIFHRWYGGMPCHYESFGGRQWNSDNTNPLTVISSDTVFDPHPVFASIIQAVSCYGGNNGVIQFNTNPLNYYTYSINTGPASLSNTFSGLAAGTYTLHITDSFANSCDTIITLTQPSSLGSKQTVTNCGAFTWSTSAVTYNTSGTYFFNSATAGCPKQDTLVLTITNNTTANSTITAYNTYTWPANGVTYTSSGNYFFSAATAPGCQTFYSLNLNIIYSSFNMNLVVDAPISCYGNNDGSIQATAFPAGSNYIYRLDGNTQINNSGSFIGLSPGTHTVCVMNGTTGPSVCRTITLVNPPPLAVTFVTDSIVSCHGNDGGLTAMITGGTPSYDVSWTNSSSLVVSTSATVSGIPAGPYQFHILDDRGCILNVPKFMNAAAPLVVTATVPPIKCNGGTTSIIPASTGGIAPVVYTMFGYPLGSSYPAGTYTITATDAKGCTATTVVDFGSPAPLSSYMVDSSCNSYYWSMNGGTYTASGFYVAMLTTVSGCTIVNMLDLTITNNTSSTQNITTCNSYYWPLKNVTYTASGSYTATSLNSSGCLHTTTLNLVLNQSTTGHKTATACDSYTWTAPGASNPYTASGNYLATSINAAGCLHTDTLHLTINHSNTASQTVVACNTYNWTVTGASNPYTTSGNYTATSLNASGCLHTDTLHLTINHSNTASQTVVACNTYNWTVTGASNPYTTSGNYTATSLNTSGCLHTDTLHLTIKQSSSSSTSSTANNSYTWSANSTTYTNSGVYTTTLLNAVGCDSVLTLNLTINQVQSMLTVKCFIEGYMQSANLMKPVLANQLQTSTPSACDTIKVELHNANPPYNMLYTLKTVLGRNGIATCIFPPLAANYYIVVKHRNALQTWSSVPVFIGGNPVNYNFTTAANQAYGANQVQLNASTWAFYSGDILIDENIDLIDMGLIETDITNFEYGYRATDINGDGSVDLLDTPIVESNLINYIFSHHPN